MIDWLPDSGVVVALAGVLGSYIKYKADNRRFVKRQQADIDRSKAESALIVRTLLVILRNLEEETRSGDADAEIRAIERFLIDASHK